MNNTRYMTQRQIQAVWSVTQSDKKRGPDSEGPIRRMKKLIVIDGDPMMVSLGARLLKGICEVPEGIQNVTSLEQAKELVDKHMPDIVVNCMRIEEYRPSAHRELLDHAKERNPDAKVVLWSGGLDGGVDMEGAKHRYDAMVLRTDTGMLRRIVASLSV